MRASVRLLFLLALAGCDAADRITTGTPLVSLVGPLTFSVTDFSAMAGVLWIQPTAQGEHGAVTAKAIRYGSLCSTAVSARADVTGTTVVLHVEYAPRAGAVCTNEVRALEYDARISGLSAGRYDVRILHSDDGGVTEMEVRRQSVDVT